MPGRPALHRIMIHAWLAYGSRVIPPFRDVLHEFLQTPPWPGQRSWKEAVNLPTHVQYVCEGVGSCELYLRARRISVCAHVVTSLTNAQPFASEVFLLVPASRRLLVRVVSLGCVAFERNLQ